MIKIYLIFIEHRPKISLLVTLFTLRIVKSDQVLIVFINCDILKIRGQ